VVASKSWKAAATTKASSSSTTSPRASSSSATTDAAAAAPPTPGSATAENPTAVDHKAAAAAAAAAEKSQRGLRHFSMMVCQKVEEKGTTTYNEVADELVKKVVADRRKLNPTAKLDEKNIRRRVYDALNVLMAMDIIAKDKKEITWKGLPTTSSSSGTTQAVELMQRELEFRKHQVERKREALRELLVQQVCFRNLVQHNHQRAEAVAAVSAAAAAAGGGGGGMHHPMDPSRGSHHHHHHHHHHQPAGSSSGGNINASPADEKIPLPFIVVNTHSSAVIQCEMSPDREEVMFDFSMPFEINDDNSILKRLGM
jgi:transcription factor Dp-1